MRTRSFLKGRDRGSFLKFIIMMMVLTMFMACSTVTAHAKPKLSTKKVTLISGKKKTVKLKGAKGTVTWTSSNENVATVSKKGKKVKITATGAGKAKIIARNKGKNYKITVKVKGVRNPGNNIPIGKSVRLKASGIGKVTAWTSNNTGIVSVNKKTGVITVNRPGSAKITAKGSKGRATIVLNIPANNPVYVNPSNPSSGGSGTSGSGSSGGTSAEGSSGTISGGTYTPPASPSYPIVSNNPKYHYEIQVLNSGTVDGHESAVFNDSDMIAGASYEAIQRGVLLYIKTDAPGPVSSVGGSSWVNSAYTFLIDGKYLTKDSLYLVSSTMQNAHYESSGRPVGGDFVIVKTRTPGTHTIEIVEDLDNSIWDGETLTYHLKSYTKTGVSIKINFHDYNAEYDRWAAEIAAKYTSAGMTDREKAEALRNYFLKSDKYHHYQVVHEADGSGGDTRYISYINFTPFFVSGIGDCIEANDAYQKTLEKAGLTNYKWASKGSHRYTMVYLDGEWVNMDVAKSNLNLYRQNIKYIN